MFPLASIEAACFVAADVVAEVQSLSPVVQGVVCLLPLLLLVVVVVDTLLLVLLLLLLLFVRSRLRPVEGHVLSFFVVVAPANPPPIVEGAPIYAGSLFFFLFSGHSINVLSAEGRGEVHTRIDYLRMRRGHMHAHNKVPGVVGAGGRAGGGGVGARGQGAASAPGSSGAVSSSAG